MFAGELWQTTHLLDLMLKRVSDQLHITKNVTYGLTPIYGLFLDIGKARTVYGLGIWTWLQFFLLLVCLFKLS